jgi:predicted DNA-binding transcriptional regulator YafY
MRRAERLFAILQFLRARRRPVTARELAGELEVSLRTIYRDTAELVAQRVPLRGGAGVGYVLDAGYDLPPLMLTADELEAAMLGAAWVSQRGDPSLARGARSLIEKIGQVVPPTLRPLLLDAGLRPAEVRDGRADGVDVGPIRRAIRDHRKLEIRYADGQGNETTRVVWPLFIAFLDDARIVAAYCELRGGFRHFRTDRVREVRVLDERPPEARRALAKRWEEEMPWARGRLSGQ